MLVQKMIQNKVDKGQGEEKRKEGKASFFLYINNQMPNAGRGRGIQTRR